MVCVLNKHAKINSSYTPKLDYTQIECTFPLPDWSHTDSTAAPYTSPRLLRSPSAEFQLLCIIPIHTSLKITITGNEIKEKNAIANHLSRFLVDVHAIDNHRYEVAIQQSDSAPRVYSFTFKPSHLLRYKFWKRGMINAMISLLLPLSCNESISVDTA